MNDCSFNPTTTIRRATLNEQVSGPVGLGPAEPQSSVSSLVYSTERTSFSGEKVPVDIKGPQPTKSALALLIRRLHVSGPVQLVDLQAKILLFVGQIVHDPGDQC